ncbi:MAG: hypothetical protein SH817_14335 [Leptospira sp.]|nr:hypothetical protein [Leptospira sp.]
MSQNLFEFTEKDSDIFLRYSTRMSLVGKVLIMLGVLFVAGGLISIKDHYGNIIEGLVQIGIGYLTVRASYFFREISKIETRDIEHLRKALLVSIKLYTLQLYFYAFIFFLALFTLFSLAWTNLS